VANSRICSVEGCGKPHEAHGYCPMHYTRWRKHGDPLYEVPLKNYGPICSVEGCEKPSRERGWCSMHYARWLTHGDVNYAGKPRPKTKLQKFIEEAVAYKGDDCLYWPWPTKSRRGSIFVDGRLVKAPRYVCTLVHGEPPTPEYEAAHSCGHGWEVCLNPNHLRWATPIENAADRYLHGTDARGENNPGAVLTETNVREIRKLLRRGMKQKDIGKIFGVSRGAILSINLRKSWGWLED